MLREKSLVLYKNNASIIQSDDKGKYTVKYRSVPATATKPAQYATQSVRPKDFIVLCESPVSSIENVLSFAEQNCPKEEDIYNLDNTNEFASEIKEAWELLLSDEETQSAPVSFEELVQIFRGELKADEAFADYVSLKNTIYFNQSTKDAAEGNLIFIPRSQEEIDSIVNKANEKNQEKEIREAFISRLKERKLEPTDSKFMVDVEALALGTTDKSRTLHDANLKETPESAHKVLLETGIWNLMRNPYPSRWGLSMQSAKEGLSSPPDEERVKLDHVSFAIDNAYSDDPDDAVYFDGTYLWVHIADPASTVMPDSSIDKTARGRGTTLYLPEGASRMLCETCLEDYALGLKEWSNALSFRILLDENGNIEQCDVLKTLVKVKRYTYEQADELKESEELKPLFEIARRNVERRNKNGAVQISMPEVHITVDKENQKVNIEKDIHPESSIMVREMMLLAGEGAAKFAFKNNIPFAYISQDAPDIPKDIPEGLAGQFRLRRCMKKRSVGVTPAPHNGLGLSFYTQVTSPLRRYTDLICHEQLRSYLDGRPLIDKDDMLFRISEGDAGGQASHKAERQSRMHWTLVYLLQNPEWRGEAVCVDLSQKLPLFSIPSLAQECFIGGVECALNDTIMVKAEKINITEQTVNFVKAE